MPEVPGFRVEGCSHGQPWSGGASSPSLKRGRLRMYCQPCSVLYPTKKLPRRRPGGSRIQRMRTLGEHLGAYASAPGEPSPRLNGARDFGWLGYKLSPVFARRPRSAPKRVQLGLYWSWLHGAANVFRIRSNAPLSGSINGLIGIIRLSVSPHRHHPCHGLQSRGGLAPSRRHAHGHRHSHPTPSTPNSI